MQQQVESAGQLVAVSQASGLGLGGLGGVGGLGGDGGGLGFFLMGYDACAHQPERMSASDERGMHSITCTVPLTSRAQWH